MKDLIEAQRSSIHRSSTSKLPSKHVRRYMEKNEETTIKEKVKLKINGGLRSTYLKLLCSDYHLMEACLWSFYGYWIFELQ